MDGLSAALIAERDNDVKTLAARIWRMLAGSIQWRILWFKHAKFMIGVTGVVRDDDGNVLLLRHRFWPQDRPWGLPTGYADKGERFEETVAREVAEETGLTVEVGRLVALTSGYRLRVEVAYEATVTGDRQPEVDGFEVLEARWFPPHDLPQGLLESHRLLIGRTVS
ncbi:NUDIX domain-containing protein [Thermostaphylospora chromogena]|uniref:ADP-ribose pyrophosphatase YjhB, NUDIX family n=1 Tax=Thermostaphylospora chromogena TaxID=35622 RepID=A0A1H1H6B3_9ACTN|nr:NUDIX domain-containing protein [Thermostaphylospora chromogena]SDR21045.1 ADP-ribose pyrophosphatase YjhB, NUDIX family [Thermostaphylospora chromogena]